MKPANCLQGLLICLILSGTIRAQSQTGIDSTGLPGDNFDLQGALEMFRKASSPEEFEKLINTRDNNINNLDLNEDGDIDYVRVIDRTEKDVHAFVLQVPVSETESQDIAVIELEKTGDTTAVLQIVGDENIYGEEVIVEPTEEADNAGNMNGIDIVHGGMSHGPDAGYHHNNPRIVINVWQWPAVRFIYAPRYIVWHSPWKWRYYPSWWRPWRPLMWQAYYPLRLRYYRPFSIVHTHRTIHAHRFYTPLRVNSVTVRTRHQTALNNYRVSRTRTTITGPRGNQVSRKTTTIKGPRGNKVKRTRTAVRKR